MRQLARPPFPFSGAWLQGGGLMLHLIEDDPTIPWKSEYTWKVCWSSITEFCTMECISPLTGTAACPAHRTHLLWTGPSPGTSGGGRTRVRITC